MTDTEALHTLDRAARLQANWDGHDGRPISIPALVACRNILSDEDSDPPTALTPRADGGLQLTWTLPYARVQIDILPESRIELFVRRPAAEGATLLVAVRP